MAGLNHPCLRTNADFEALLTQYSIYPIELIEKQLYFLVFGTYPHLRAVKHSLDAQGWETIWDEASLFREIDMYYYTHYERAFTANSQPIHRKPSFSKPPADPQATYSSLASQWTPSRNTVSIVTIP